MSVRFNFASVRQTRPTDYAVRFLFGGTVTLVAGLLAKKYGPTVGGLFLTFPAIFPAGVTLIAKHEERRRQQAGLEGKKRGAQAAALDARGAIFGTCGLLLFAVTAHWLLPVLPAVAALGISTMSWLFASVLVWRFS